jgi:hypothetical protein
MTYSELVTQIQNYMETTFTTAIVNNFIKQAEQRIYNSVQIPSLRRNVTGTTTDGNKYLQCPSDFLSVYSMAVVKANGEYEYLLNKDVNYIRQVYPSPTYEATPKYYAIFGPDYSLPRELTFLLGPTPDAAYTIELHYFYYPESIVTAASGQSWLGDNFDSVLLYGSLREAYLLNKGEQDLVANVEAKYGEAMALLKQLGDGKERQDAYRSGQVRVPVTT